MKAKSISIILLVLILFSLAALGIAFAAGAFKQKPEPVVSLTPPPFEYIGCYEDKPERALANKLGDGITSAQQCKDLASSKGYTYFGLQWNNECWAGNDGYDKYQKFDDSKCKLKCTGQGGQGDVVSTPECGGGWTNSVYKIN